ncbi:hypothetical protein EDD11_002153 [Mortierella claussenii]|nr:hypothetical protein EDD11_002153 [Mortierella claussenii]
MIESTALRSEHLHMFLASCAIHITYFYLIKSLVPSIGKDRRRLSWVLTLTTAIIVSIAGPMNTFHTLRTIFSDPVPYTMYASSPASINNFNNNAVVASKLFRYDITFPSDFDSSASAQQGNRKGQDSIIVTLDPSLIIQKQPSEDQSHLESSTRSEKTLDQKKQVTIKIDTQADDVRARIKFYEAIDAPYLSSSSSRTNWRTISPSSFWHSVRHSRWFFDLRFTPSDSPVSQATVIFFACYLVLDIVLGSVHYRERISILTGWFHHIMYMGICYYTIVTGQAHIFASFMIIEIPTIIMGFGFLHKAFRKDILFGLSFLAFRIVFDFVLTHEMIMNRPSMSAATKAILLFKSAMNFKFFLDWISQQTRLRKNSSGDERTVDAVETTTKSISISSKNMAKVNAGKNSGISGSKGIVSNIYNDQTSQEVLRPQEQQQQQHWLSSSKRGKWRLDSNKEEPYATAVSFSILASTSSRSMTSRTNIKSQDARARAVSDMMENHTLADMITVH